MKHLSGKFSIGYVQISFLADGVVNQLPFLGREEKKPPPLKDNSTIFTQKNNIRGTNHPQSPERQLEGPCKLLYLILFFILVVQIPICLYFKRVLENMYF